MSCLRGQQGRFHQERRLIPDRVIDLARDAGFARAGFVDPSGLARWKDATISLSRRGFFRHEELATMEREWLFHPEGWSGAASILVCVLPYNCSEPDDLSTPGDAHALIAPFARRNHYKEAAGRMNRALRLMRDTLGIDSRNARIFSNSRIPEKPMLAASGIGAYGKNSLCLVEGLGSSFVIAGAVLPIPTCDMAPEQSIQPAAEPCGACTRCMEACPTGAIVEPGIVDPARCLQGFASRATRLEPPLMDAWGYRLYGCQDCQSACPLNRDLPRIEQGKRVRELTPRPGEIGPSLSLRRLLSLDRDGRRDLFRGTALGLSWICDEALLRNALVTAGNRRDRDLSAEISRHLAHESLMIREAARWALEKLASG